MPPKASTGRPGARRPEGSESAPTPANDAELAAQNASEARGTPAQSATPGPSGRPSVQRLQSLKKRAPSSSIPPSGRPTSALGGEPAKPARKFQPRAVVRRSKEEREAMEKLEQERHKERLKEAVAIQRGRGGRGGRGAFRGRGAPAGMGVSGPFGSGEGGARRGRGSGVFGGSSSGRDRTRSAISGGSCPPMDDEYSDEDDSVLRVDINNINDVDSEDEDERMPRDIKGKMPYRPKSGGLLPYRVHRIEHEERVVSVNMESSSSRSAELRKKAEEEKAANEPRVKEEPADDGDATMAGAAPHAEDDGYLPAQKVRVRRKVPPSPQKAKATRQDPIEVEPEQKRDPRELLRTKEEIDEYDRHLEDLHHVRNLLFHEESASQTTTTGPEPERPQRVERSEGESATEVQDEDGPQDQTEDKAANQNLLGQLFLMQFPPMTPNLTIPGTEQPAPEPAPAPRSEIKPEGDDIEIVDADAPQSTETPTPKVITATTDWSLPAGRAGKLNVHKSGRLTLDWGGISFELDRATSVDFVQEALIVSSPAADEPGQPAKDEETEQRAWSMGQLCGKFTVMPNWDQML